MPTLFSVAPVNAPRTCPNNSLSNKVSTTAEQLTVTNRLIRLGPARCSARAASSLPVPVSPEMSAVLTWGARRRINPNSSCITGLRPIIPWYSSWAAMSCSTIRNRR